MTRKNICFLLLAALSIPLFQADAAPAKIKKPRRLLRPASAGYGSYNPKLIWKTPLRMSADTTPAIADLDADGGLDLIVVSNIVGQNNRVESGAISRLNERGEVVWRFPTSQPITAGPALGDVDRDGLLDLVVCADKIVLCLNARGQLKWRRELTFNADFDPTKADLTESVPTMADLDGDGKNEVLIGTNDGTLWCFDSKGKTRWSVKAKSWIVGGVAVADLGFDKGLEVVFGSYDRNLYCLNAQGKLKWREEVGDWISGAPVIGDLENDGSSEIVFSADDGLVRAFTRTGTEKWQARFSENEERNKPYLALADLDGDGTLETLATEDNGTLHVFLSDGSQAWQVNFQETSAAPLVADLNGDGYQEIILADDSGFSIYEAWGRQTYRRNFGQPIDATPALVDSDRDSKWEIAVASGAQTRGTTDYLSFLEFDRKGGAAKWATLKGDPYRTGWVQNARDYGQKARAGMDYATAFEPYGLGARPKTGKLAPRRLRVSLLPLDDARGNRDGALDPGETAWIRAKVQNLGTGASFDNTLKLDLGRSFLRLDRASAYLGYLAPGATKTATFRLSAPSIEEIKALTDPKSDVEKFVDPNEIGSDEPATVDPKTRKKIVRTRRGKKKIVAVTPKPSFGAQVLTLSVLESGVPGAFSRATVFNVPPLAPSFKIAKTTILDKNSRVTSGNGNGRLDAGENVVLRLLVKNVDLTTAQSATATLSSGTKDVLAATPSVALKNAVPFGGRTLDFSLRVASRPFSPKANLKLAIYAVTTGGKVLPQAQNLVLPIGRAQSDISPPQIVLQSPKTAIFDTRAATFRISGVVKDASKIVALSFERNKAPLLAGNRFSFVRKLQIGENVFPISATDAAGNSSTRYVRVIRKP